MAFKKSRQQKLSDKEKRNTQIFTLVSLLDTSVLNAEQIDFIQQYFKVYKQIKRRYAKLIKQHSEYTDFRPKDIKALADPQGILPYRVFGGIETSVKGLLDSQKTNLSNTLLNLEYKIKQQQKKVKGLKESLENLNKTPDKEKHAVRLGIKIPQTKRSLFHASGKLDRMLKKQQCLKNKYQNSDYSICFGSRRLLKQRDNIHVNDHDNIRHWRQQWHFRRHDEIFSVGKKDDRYGNGNMQVSMDDAGNFQLRLIVPTAMREQYSFKSVTVSKIYTCIYIYILLTVSVLSSSVFCHKVGQSQAWKHLSETEVITPDGVITQTQRFSRRILSRLKSSAVNSECYLPT